MGMFFSLCNAANLQLLQCSSLCVLPAFLLWLGWGSPGLSRQIPGTGGEPCSPWGGQGR